MMGENQSWFPAGDPLTCPECHTAVPRADWKDTEVGCEDCGSHAAIECPECGEDFDHVWGPRRFEEDTWLSPTAVADSGDSEPQP